MDSAHKLETLRSMGFDHVTNYQLQDFTKNGHRYDLILDTKTNRSTFKYLQSLSPRGRYVTIGGRLPRLLQTLFLETLISRVSKKRVRIVALKPNKDLGYINDLFEAWKLEYVIDGLYGLNDVPKALKRFGEAEHIGKIVITVVQ